MIYLLHFYSQHLSHSFTHFLKYLLLLMDVNNNGTLCFRRWFLSSLMINVELYDQLSWSWFYHYFICIVNHSYSKQCLSCKAQYHSAYFQFWPSFHSQTMLNNAYLFWMWLDLFIFSFFLLMTENCSEGVRLIIHSFIEVMC